MVRYWEGEGINQTLVMLRIKAISIPDHYYRYGYLMFRDVRREAPCLWSSSSAGVNSTSLKNPSTGLILKHHHQDMQIRPPEVSELCEIRGFFVVFLKLYRVLIRQVPLRQCSSSCHAEQSFWVLTQNSCRIAFLSSNKTHN